ncbi:MAG: hypothetical protein L3K19_01210 [Thermoplasmata archaeon]|nr:hypothetical protein [Thermoplasmata archaeon]
MFTAELRAARSEEKGAGDRAATHLVSPYGARMSRVLIAGTIEPPQGAPGATGFLRSRLADPTGEVALTAGSFQPRGLEQLGAVQEPVASLVVGKAHLYRARDGSERPSVRVEAIRGLEPPELRDVYSEILTQSLARLRLVESGPTGSHPRVAGPEGAPPAIWVEAARASRARYPEAEFASYRHLLRPVVDALDPVGTPAPRAGSSRSPEALAPGHVTRTVAPIPEPGSPAPTASERAQESEFLDLVDELSDSSIDGYADLRDLQERCARAGWSEEHTERLLNRLEEAGTLEEPIVGRLRRA